MAEQLEGDERGRLRFVVTAMALNVGLSVVSSIFRLGWISAAAIVLFIDALYVAWIVRRRDTLLLRLLLLGLAAGWVELLADWYAVSVTGTLVYPRGEPFVERSPLYMPFAWTAIVVQLGYLGWRLAERLSLPLASLVTGLIGAVNIPIYEALAKRAGWWSYRGVPMLADAPWYIIVAELLIALALPAAVRFAARRELGWSVVTGIAVGLWMWAATAIAFALVG